MDCPVCQWKGNLNGYRQHLQTEKHVMKCEISRLTRQVTELKVELNTIADKYDDVIEKNDMYKELLKIYGIDRKARHAKLTETQRISPITEPIPERKVKVVEHVPEPVSSVVIPRRAKVVEHVPESEVVIPKRKVKVVEPEPKPESEPEPEPVETNKERRKRERNEKEQAELNEKMKKQEKQFKKDKKEMIKFFEKINRDNWKSMCLTNNELYSPEINKLKHVIGDEYSQYNECSYAIHLDNNVFNYVRVITMYIKGENYVLDDYSHSCTRDKVERDPIEKFENRELYMPQSTRNLFNKEENHPPKPVKLKTNRQLEQIRNKIFDLYDSMDKCNYKEYTEINHDDEEEMIKFKTLFRNDYEKYGYTTLNLNVFPDNTIMYNRLTKGCGFDDPVLELF